jgi:hypothetical protein
MPPRPTCRFCVFCANTASPVPECLTVPPPSRVSPSPMCNRTQGDLGTEEVLGLRFQVQEGYVSPPLSVSACAVPPATPTHGSTTALGAALGAVNRSSAHVAEVAMAPSRALPTQEKPAESRTGGVASPNPPTSQPRTTPEVVGPNSCKKI